ncbi:MAG: ABC1 kinase family protein, partial [Microcoleaceae cyanobacterium]
YEQASKIIEEDLGKAVNQLFTYFDEIPLAAASLGQVHKAKLQTGEEVVVKVQRPGLKKLFSIDLTILKGIAYYFQNHPKWGKGRDWIGIYDECCRILWEEIEYLNEGRNADTFRRNFRDCDWVKVPRVYWRYSAPRVLTLEYLPGIKISHYEGLEASGIDRKLLARLSAKAYLQQLLNDGFFHADPHPGNIAVNADGSLIFYDFGMMGQIRTDIREKLMQTLFGVASKDAEKIVDSLVELGALVPTGDMGPVRRSIQYMLDNFMDKPFEAQSITAISDDLYDIAYDQPFRFPATFTFVMRAFSTLEGVGKGLDPDFNFMEVAQPFAIQIMNDGNLANTSNTIFNEIGRQAAQVSSSAFSLPGRIENAIDKLEQGDIRVRVRATETDRLIRRLGNAQLSTTYALLITGFTGVATALFLYDKVIPASIFLGLAVIVSVFLLKLIRKMERFDKIS